MKVQIRSSGIIEALLKISRARRDFFRTYTLTAENDLGVRSASVRLEQSKVLLFH